MVEPSFTVVVPCFNGAAYLAAALRSALDQTHPAAEILVIDDGSTDGSLEIARSLGPRVVSLSQPHQGPSAARNLGADRAQGTFVAFLDADDVWLPDKLERQARVLRAAPEVGLVYTGLHRLYPDGSLVEVRARPPAWTIPRLTLECPLLPSTVVVRTDLVREVRWSSQFGSSEDWDLFYRLSRRCRFGFVEESTTRYRQHAESLSSRDWRAVLENARRVSATIQRDQHGLAGERRRRMVEARLQAGAAIAARDAGSREDLGHMLRSLATWPFPAPGRRRYRILGKMLLQHLRPPRRSPRRSR